MGMEKQLLKLMEKEYSFDLLLKYTQDRSTHITKFITKQIQGGAVHNQKLVVIYKAIVRPYYEQKLLSQAS